MGWWNSLSPLLYFLLLLRHAAGDGFFARFESGFRWCLAVLSPSPGGCCSGCVRARLRRVFCLRAGACFFSFRGFRLVTSPRCGGGFFARFESGFRWCLAVLSPLPGGCRVGCVRARLRCVFCLRAGACFFSFRGFRLVTSPRCGGGFFARFEPGFRWCLAVLSPSPGGCCSGCVRARLRRVFCLRAGACLFSFRGWARLRHVFCLRRVAKNCGTLASFAACCWNLLLPRLAFGTFFLQGCAAKLLGTKNLAKHWRYAAF